MTSPWFNQVKIDAGRIDAGRIDAGRIDRIDRRWVKDLDQKNKTPKIRCDTLKCDNALKVRTVQFRTVQFRTVQLNTLIYRSPKIRAACRAACRSYSTFHWNDFIEFIELIWIDLNSLNDFIERFSMISFILLLSLFYFILYDHIFHPGFFFLIKLNMELNLIKTLRLKNWGKKLRLKTEVKNKVRPESDAIDQAQIYMKSWLRNQLLILYDISSASKKSGLIWKRSLYQII